MDSQLIPGTVNSKQTVDPEVSKAKFERELKAFSSLEDFYRERGIILIRASFPDVVLIFTAARIRPLMTVFAVKINFTNYNIEAPSVQFIDPLTEAPLKMEQLGSHMARRSVVPKDAENKQGQAHVIPSLSTLIQAHQPHQIPFLCLPGVREYHRHPAHSQDPWLAHRNTGEGTLGFLVDQLHKYGTDPVNGYCAQNFNVQQAAAGIIQIQPTGLIFTLDINLIPL